MALPLGSLALEGFCSTTELQQVECDAMRVLLHHKVVTAITGTRALHQSYHADMVAWLPRPGAPQLCSGCHGPCEGLVWTCSSSPCPGSAVHQSTAGRRKHLHTCYQDLPQWHKASLPTGLYAPWLLHCLQRHIVKRKQRHWTRGRGW